MEVYYLVKDIVSGGYYDEEAGRFRGRAFASEYYVKMHIEDRVKRNLFKTDIEIVTVYRHEGE